MTEYSEPVKPKKGIATYHLPGLFEFYDLYRMFLPLFYGHREYFYDWCETGSIYGAPAAASGRRLATRRRRWH